jgi:hypothetical protein
LSNARCIADLLNAQRYRLSHSSRSSSTVRSGFSATSFRSAGYSDAAILGRTPPPWARGATSSVSLSRRNHLDTLASPTLNSSAIWT